MGYISPTRRYNQSVPADVDSDKSNESEIPAIVSISESETSSDIEEIRPFTGTRSHNRPQDSTTPPSTPSNVPPTPSFPTSTAPVITDPLDSSPSLSYPCDYPSNPVPRESSSVSIPSMNRPQESTTPPSVPSKVSPTPSFPTSPPPDIRDILHESHAYPCAYPSELTPLPRDYALDYENVMIAVSDLNAVTQALLQRSDNPNPNPNPNTTREHVMEMLGILRLMLQRMYTRLESSRNS